MFEVLLGLLLTASKSEVPPDRWVCANDIEVWCSVDSCTAKQEDETTPMAISADAEGEIAVCAYTGCWEARVAPIRADGRALWVANDVPFSSNDAASADVSLLIIERDGVGFLRVGAIASPLLCRRGGAAL